MQDRSAAARRAAAAASMLAGALLLVATAALAATAGSSASTSATASGTGAAPWPSKAIRFVVPFPPGGPLDISARLIGSRLAERFAQPVLVDNRPGAGGSLGAQLVARSAGDGYTLLMGALSTHAVNPYLYPAVGYDAVRDFTPVTLVANVPNVLVVHPSIKADSVQALLALARARPGGLAFASGGSGSGGHLAGELLKATAKIELVHVPYKGAAPALADLVGGQVPMMFDNLASALPQVRAGKVRALAVTTRTRSAFLPELPTMQEAGVPGFDISTWFGVFTPAGLPVPILDRLHRAIVDSLQLPEVRERLATFGSEPVGNTPAQFAAFIRAEQPKYARIIRDSGARAD